MRILPQVLLYESYSPEHWSTEELWTWARSGWDGAAACSEFGVGSGSGRPRVIRLVDLEDKFVALVIVVEARKGPLRSPSIPLS